MTSSTGIRPPAAWRIASARLWRWLLPAWLALCAPSAPALIGGHLDEEDAYGAVVALSLGKVARCSAVKIGPRRFLSAAHCVVDTRTGTLNAAFRPGGTVFVSNRVTPRGRGDFIALTVDRTWLHPSYREALRRFFLYKEEKIRAYRSRYEGEDLARRIRVLEADNHFTARFPDVVVLSVQEATDAIPSLGVSCEPLHAGDRVRIVGYGQASLEGVARARKTAPFGRRHWADTQVIRVDPVNFYTYGGLLRAGAPSTSPGDSGGPILFHGRVVGVNGTVYGLSRLDAARSNMSVNLAGLGASETGRTGEGCRAFFARVRP